jgi:hypothetical protein
MTRYYERYYNGDPMLELEESAALAERGVVAEDGPMRRYRRVISGELASVIYAGWSDPSEPLADLQRRNEGVRAEIYAPVEHLSDGGKRWRTWYMDPTGRIQKILEPEYDGNNSRLKESLRRPDGELVSYTVYHYDKNGYLLELVRFARRRDRSPRRLIAAPARDASDTVRRRPCRPSIGSRRRFDPEDLRALDEVLPPDFGTVDEDDVATWRSDDEREATAPRRDPRQLVFRHLHARDVEACAGPDRCTRLVALEREQPWAFREVELCSVGGDGFHSAGSNNEVMGRRAGCERSQDPTVSVVVARPQSTDGDAVGRNCESIGVPDARIDHGVGELHVPQTMQAVTVVRIFDDEVEIVVALHHELDATAVPQQRRWSTGFRHHTNALGVIDAVRDQDRCLRDDQARRRVEVAEHLLWRAACQRHPPQAAVGDLRVGAEVTGIDPVQERAICGECDGFAAHIGQLKLWYAPTRPCRRHGGWNDLERARLVGRHRIVRAVVTCEEANQHPSSPLHVTTLLRSEWTSP